MYGQIRHYHSQEQANINPIEITIFLAKKLGNFKKILFLKMRFLLISSYDLRNRNNLP